MTKKGISIVRLGQGTLVTFLCLSLQLADPGAGSAHPWTGCSWSDPSVESLLAAARTRWRRLERASGLGQRGPGL